MLVLSEPTRALASRYHEGEVAADEVDAHPVLSRWARVRELGARSDSPAHPEGVAGTELCVRREKLEAAFREEWPMLAPVAEELSGRGLLSIVADPEGVILLARGGAGLDREATRVRLVEGARWSEGARGTNAIGTAILERRAVAVIGAAHFEARNRGLFCYATPILDPYGDLVAVLDVSGPVGQDSPAVGIAVQAAGAALSRSLTLREYAAATAGGYALVERMLARSPVPALLVSAGGAVMAVNEAARVALGVNEARGLSAQRVFGTNPDTLCAMATSGGGTAGLRPRSAEAMFETRTGRYRLEVEPVFGAAGRLLSMIVYLEPERSRDARSSLEGRTSVGSGVGQRAAAGKEHPAFEGILGTDPELTAARRMAARFAPTPLPLLLLAETGTGKELFARATHAASPRARGPFVALNCGALAPSLLESELFGHAPGAFTGAQRGGSTGKIASADGGTLFLDEIAEMPEALQATLLRVLEDGSYYRVGESRARRADFRLICATCRDLPALVHAGRFRRDLFFRIQGACVTIPPLRARADRLVLARGLLVKLAAESHVPCPELADTAVEWILGHGWPGNVRELKSALEHALVMADGGGVIDAACFPRVILGDPPPAPSPSLSREAAPSLPRELDAPGTRSRDDILRDAMTTVLRDAGGNVSEAARRLGVARSTLYRHVAPKGKGG